MDGPQTVTDEWATADLCDAHPERVCVVTTPMLDLGGTPRFRGEVRTLRVFEDYRPVLSELTQQGRGCVLVVDGGGSIERAVLGEHLLGHAASNGWAGVVVFGAVRDTRITRAIPTGLRALATISQRGESGHATERMIPVKVGGVSASPGDWLWADDDGIVISDGPLQAD